MKLFLILAVVAFEACSGGKNEGNVDAMEDTRPTRRSMRAPSVDSTDSSTAKMPATYTPGSASPPCTMHTYFSPRPLEDVASRAGNAETLRSWRTAWETSGWNVRVLTMQDAKAHPDYSRLHASFAGYPTLNNRDYEMACFLRHLAMANVGGGWMSDYDVLPLALPACAAPSNKGKFTTHQSFVPSLVSGAQDEFLRVSNLLGTLPWRENPQFFTVRGAVHISDMKAMMFLSSKGSIQTYPARGVNPKCGLVEITDLFDVDEAGLSCFALCPPPPQPAVGAPGKARGGFGPLGAHVSHASMAKLQAAAQRLGKRGAPALKLLPPDVQASLRGDPATPGALAALAGAPGALAETPAAPVLGTAAGAASFHHVRGRVIEATPQIYASACVKA